jgi:hypothetical protein
MQDCCGGFSGYQNVHYISELTLAELKGRIYDAHHLDLARKKSVHQVRGFPRLGWRSDRSEISHHEKQQLHAQLFTFGL